MRDLDRNPEMLLTAGGVTSFDDFDDIGENVILDFIIGNCMPEITALTDQKAFYNSKGELYFAESLIADLKWQMNANDDLADDVGNAIWSDEQAIRDGYVNQGEYRFLTELVNRYRSFLTCLSRLNAGEILPLDELDDFICYVFHRGDLANFEDAFEMSSKADAPTGTDELVFRALCNGFYCMNRE